MELCLPVICLSDELEFSITFFQIEIIFQMSLFNKVLMSQVYRSIIRPVIAYTFLLGFVYLCVFQNMHCDEKSSMMHSNVRHFIYLLVYCFIYLFNTCLFD